MPPDHPLPELRVLPDAEGVAAAAATDIAEGLRSAIEERGVAHWATTGGSSAAPIYRLLAAPPLRDRVDWQHVHVWWGDDRFVPSDHPASNVQPLEQILLVTGGDEGQVGRLNADAGAHGLGVVIDADNLHPVRVSEAIAHGTGTEGAAAAYAAEIASLVPAGPDGVPAFDVLVLGVGGDGHILSVFPGSEVWDRSELVVGVPAPTHIEPHIPRVTIHPRLIGAARRVLVVTTGSSKAESLGRAWTGDDVRELPVRAARIPGATWYVDEPAATGLVGG
ncbi:MAG TPA: 6-phosphogluconolactonase [Candidatus Limnocylindrales bacterium]|nr:6-phosphogluconolactonase [Candidatus Limnocylindrales bacterium]